VGVATLWGYFVSEANESTDPTEDMVEKRLWAPGWMGLVSDGVLGGRRLCDE
jgi:hypothetical protein